MTLYPDDIPEDVAVPAAPINPDYQAMDRASRRMHAAHAHLTGRDHPDPAMLAEMANFDEELALVQALSGYDSYCYALAQAPDFVEKLRVHLRAQRTIDRDRVTHP